MKNIEKYEKELRKIGAFFAINMDDKPCECSLNIACTQCKLHSSGNCQISRMEWLLENADEINWNEVEVNTAIKVSNIGVECAQNRHFAFYKKGKVYAWNNGKTSHTSKENEVTEWEYAWLVEK